MITASWTTRPDRGANQLFESVAGQSSASGVDVDGIPPSIVAIVRARAALVRRAIGQAGKPVESVADVFASWTRPVGGEGLGLVDFEIFPHLDNPDLLDNTSADAERWAAGLTRSGYAIDDETAIMVVDGVTDVISEGHWRLFES